MEDNMTGQKLFYWLTGSQPSPLNNWIPTLSP